ncbi:MAG: hypothetical protein N2512_09400 [Armatimonadetes bacterium]|nr:hypothetical protein [Armatimonadota bacterium]
MTEFLLSLGVAALAACAAVTRQPADFGLRQWLAVVVLAAAATVCGVSQGRVGMAWPLLAGLSLAAVYRMSYDPVLPEALAGRLPVRVALLEPTTPMALAGVMVIWWALTARRRVAPLPAAECLALRSLLWTVRLLIVVGAVLYLVLGTVYDLEGGVVFWKLVVSCALYAGLMWVGIEAAAKGLLRWPVAGVMLLGLVVGFLRNLSGGGGS